MATTLLPDAPTLVYRAFCALPKPDVDPRADAAGPARAQAQGLEQLREHDSLGSSQARLARARRGEQ